MSNQDHFEHDLQTNKIWEGSGTVLEIVPRGTSLYRVVFFSEYDGSLNFVQVAIYKDIEKLKKLIQKLGVKPCGDRGIVLKEVSHEKPGVGK
jgi:hypothetical protein